MTHDEFYLTPLDVRTQRFKRVIRGYDPIAVDEFRDRVASELERLLRENATANEQSKHLQEQVRTFREREKATSDALVVAQQLRDDVENAANKEASHIIERAKADAEAVLRDARQDEQAMRREIEILRSQYLGYLASFRVLLERNLAEVHAAEQQQGIGNGAIQSQSPNGQGALPAESGKSRSK
ncbi:MAG: DivIVA domain-containing protein [Gemmatimonadota bacterium]|nr:DivIVA domain-containing protein [Gemmatimonadota bacterium]